MPPRYIVISCACCSQLHHDTEIFNQGVLMSTARTVHGMGICDYNDGQEIVQTLLTFSEQSMIW